MNESIITWNIPNWITVVLMFLIVWVFAMGAAKLFRNHWMKNNPGHTANHTGAMAQGSA